MQEFPSGGSFAGLDKFSTGAADKRLSSRNFRISLEQDFKIIQLSTQSKAVYRHTVEFNRFCCFYKTTQTSMARLTKTKTMIKSHYLTLYIKQIHQLKAINVIV